mgnify:FL=1|jgi:hypothetical protein
MPIYLYKHPEEEHFVEVVQGMNDPHEYTDPEGVSWKRVFVPISIPPSTRSLDLNKPIYDKHGNKQRVVPLSDEFIRQQGFSNAGDYIEWNNSLVDETKTPQRNLERAHDNSNNKDIKEMQKANKAAMQKTNRAAASRKPSKHKYEVSAHTNSDWNNSDSVAEYDAHAKTKKHQKVTIKKKK